MTHDIREENGWFVAYHAGERIGRFDCRKRAEKTCERWAQSHTGALVAKSNPFTNITVRRST